LLLPLHPLLTSRNVISSSVIPMRVVCSPVGTTFGTSFFLVLLVVMTSFASLLHKQQIYFYFLTVNMSPFARDRDSREPRRRSLTQLLQTWAHHCENGPMLPHAIAHSSELVPDVV